MAACLAGKGERITLEVLEQKQNPKLYSPLTLAFLGDGVFELLVREELVQQGDRPANQLHLLAVEKVRASAQAKMADFLQGIFTEDELGIYKRGRNAHFGTVRKNINLAEYGRATGLEAVFGYLYLLGDTARIRELYRRGCEAL